MAADVMMQLGPLQFSINTAAYQRLTRSTEYRWQGQQRVGQLDALQYTGPGEDSITLSGVAYQGWRSDADWLAAMRRMAAVGLPLLMVAGTGALMGRWVVLSVREDADVFAPGGTARRQSFTLELRKYADGVS